MATRRDIVKGGVARAQYFRAHLTNSEIRLWSLLRRSRFGYRFRRQYPVGPYVLDFYCPTLKLALEIDGAEFHSEAKDLIRDSYLGDKGIWVHHLVLDDVPDWEPHIAELLAAIKARADYLACKSHRPSSAQGETMDGRA